MPSTFTTNKQIEKPASGSYNNAWAAPVNADWDDIDNALGGHSIISVTSVAGGSYALTLAQYQPPNIEFTGTLSGNLQYVIPAGVGGLWSIANITSGGFTVSFAVSGGGSFVLPQGKRSLLISDGTNVVLAQDLITAFAQLTGQVSSAQVPVGAVTQYDSSIVITFPQITGAASVGQIPGLPASQITSGTFANSLIASGNVTQWQGALSIAFTQVTGQATAAQLPTAAYRSGLGSGNVTVQNGGAPAGGASGDLFLIW